MYINCFDRSARLKMSPALTCNIRLESFGMFSEKSCPMHTLLDVLNGWPYSHVSMSPCAGFESSLLMRNLRRGAPHFRKNGRFTNQTMSFGLGGTQCFTLAQRTLQFSFLKCFCGYTQNAHRLEVMYIIWINHLDGKSERGWIYTTKNGLVSFRIRQGWIINT